MKHPRLGVILLAFLASANPGQGAPPPSFEPPKLKSDAPRPPWHRRRRVGVKRMRGRGQGLIDLHKWPREPPSPERVDPTRLGQALHQLCGWLPPRRRRRYAGWLIDHGRRFGIDPFLLGGVIYRQSLCVRSFDSTYGVGLAGINERMHAGHIRKRRYRFWLLREKRWEPTELTMDRFLFYRRNLRRPNASIYFAAVLLSVWKRQCPAIDGAFGSVPHRHFVSHLIWGDRVKGAGAEDRILRARRRLLQYYDRRLPPPTGRFRKLALHCPLDAPPRKLSSVMGDDRMGGRRRHKGVDFASTAGEPVRAIADGKVVFAGVDHAVGPAENLDPEQAKSVKRAAVGAGGLFVMIQHANKLRSVYMHLQRYTVKKGQRVKATEPIGVVGRSGIKTSNAHLHFELRFGGKHIDPVPHLRPFVFLPNETYLGQKLAAELKRVRRIRRLRRYRRKRPPAPAPLSRSRIR